MKLSNFPIALRTIDGVRQDDEIVELVKPVIKSVLEDRIRELNADLMQLGVDIEAEAARPTS